MPIRPRLLQKSSSVREATTTDGFTLMASKHLTYHIEEGTLNNAIKNGYINSQEAMMARTMKARLIARQIMQSKSREYSALVDIRQQLSEVEYLVKANYTSTSTATNNLINQEGANSAFDDASTQTATATSKVEINDDSSSLTEDEIEISDDITVNKTA